VSRISSWTLLSQILILLALDIERFYGQRKLLAQRVPILQPSLLPSDSVNRVPSQAQARILAHARALSDPLSTPSATGASTPFESETETDTELDSQQTCYNEGTGVTKLSHHDFRNRYFRRDTIVLFNFDVFRCASLTRAKNSIVIRPSSFKQG
jgi:phosphatidylethanolamine N-methyltransferase